MIIAFACSISLSTYTTVQSSFRTKMAMTVVKRKVLIICKPKPVLKCFMFHI